ncbi:MAG: hypothetical protein KC733_07285, partial [Candidatus Omnitrophica bacterium]|nr:hypothetical protein [Candidatus Omnitrophota bacterium]
MKTNKILNLFLVFLLSCPPSVFAQDTEESLHKVINRKNIVIDKLVEEKDDLAARLTELEEQKVMLEKELANLKLLVKTSESEASSTDNE